MDYLQSIKVFVEVAGSGSFINASRNMGMTASATSRMVADLEERLGARLLQRSTRHVSLTEAGYIYFEKMRSITTRLADIEHSFAKTWKEPTSVLRVRAPVSFGLTRLAPVLRSYVSRFPRVTPHLTLEDDVSRLVGRQVDVAIVADGAEIEDVFSAACRFVEYDLEVVAAPKYIEQYGRPETLIDLLPRKLLLHSDHTQILKDALIQHSALSPSIEHRVMRANNSDMLGRLVEEGAGVGILPGFSVEKAIEKGRLVRLLPDLKLPRIGLSLIYSNQVDPSPAARTFVGFVVERFLQ